VKSVLKNIYQELFQIFYDSLGQTPPLILHRIVCEDVVMNISPSGESLRILNFINDVFEELENENENISIFDIRTAPNYILDVAGNGIFVDDLIHYTAESNQWVARQVIENYCLNIKSYKSK